MTVFVVTIKNGDENVRSFVQRDKPSPEFGQALARANWYRKKGDRLSADYGNGTHRDYLGTDPSVPAFYKKYIDACDVLGLVSLLPVILAASGIYAGEAVLAMVGLVLFPVLVTPLCILWVMRLRGRSQAMKRWEVLAHGDSDAESLPAATEATYWAMCLFEDAEGCDRSTYHMERWANRYGYYTGALVSQLNSDGVVHAAYCQQQSVARNASLPTSNEADKAADEAMTAPYVQEVLRRVKQLDKWAVGQMRQELESRREGVAVVARSMETLSLES